MAVMSKKARMEQAKAFLQEANSILCSLDESPGTSSTSFQPVSRAFREFLGYSKLSYVYYLGSERQNPRSISVRGSDDGNQYRSYCSIIAT